MAAPSGSPDVVIGTTRQIVSSTLRTIAGFLPLLLVVVDRWPSLAILPVASTGPDALEACDIVVIAPPTPTHLESQRRFAHKAVRCEKPPLGAPPAPGVLEGLGGAPESVNYPFPFLDQARELGAAIEGDRLGDLRRVLLTVGVRFPVIKSQSDWFIDVAVHPVAWLLHQVGELSLVSHRVGAGSADLAAVLANGRVQADVPLYALPGEVIHVGLRAVGNRAVADLDGGHRPGAGWWFDPLCVDGVAATGGEYGQDEDIWYRANRRAVECFCPVVRGETRPTEALARSRFDLTRTVAIERMLVPCSLAARQLPAAPDDTRDALSNAQRKIVPGPADCP